MTVASFFAGCGGLDLGFEQAGFDVVWANDNDESVKETYTRNHPKTHFILADISKIKPEDIPDCDGFIGGPPCQSWSVAGKQRGLNDERGKLFVTYIELIKAKRPKFFVIENVKGLLDAKFQGIFENFIKGLERSGYNVNWKVLETAQFRIPQNRERVFIIGTLRELNLHFSFPANNFSKVVSLRDAIGDIEESPTPYTKAEKIDQTRWGKYPNNDFYSDRFCEYYHKGNRRRSWDQPSFTIHATGGNIPLHPSSPRMLYISHENWQFQENEIAKYRRLSVRECARIQTFPDTFIFEGTNILSQYRMIGNAVPPRLGYRIASSISNTFNQRIDDNCCQEEECQYMEDVVLYGYYKTKQQYKEILENKVYYTRADGRKGSCFADELQVTPKYLVLYHGSSTELYSLKDDEPYLVNSEYLEQLGFKVSGNYYLCFNIQNKIDDKLFLIEKAKERISAHSTDYLPFIDNMPVLKERLKFIDLFAGLGGFHLALKSLGCQCVFASEIKEDLRKLYKINFPETEFIAGDITKANLSAIPKHDILCAGFPCQPFSQAGKRQGFQDEAGRGNLFDSICEVIVNQGENKPRILLLENVSNLKGHDDGNTWRIIQEKLDEIGYYVKADILSPHQYGYPQHRRRIYIVGIRKDFIEQEDFKSFCFPNEHKEKNCDIRNIIDENDKDIQPLSLKTLMQLKVWQEFLNLSEQNHCPIPSFPIWAMEFGADYPFEEKAPAFYERKELIGKHGKLGSVINGPSKEDCLLQLPIYAQTDKKEKFPDWKIKYINQNRQYYRVNKTWLDVWKNKILTWDNSHQKLEWNCGKESVGNIKDKIVQFRASGIRIKKPTFSPALNLVGTQIPIFPWIKLPEECIPKYTDDELAQYNLTREDIQFGRYLSVKEAAELQGMQTLQFGELSTTRIYEALGNAVNTQVVRKIAESLIQLYGYE